MTENGVALIVGVGPGLGAALGRRFASAGMKVALASRDAAHLDPIVGQVAASGGAAHAYAADATDEAQVARCFEAVENELGPLDVAVYNASARARKSILELTRGEVEEAWRGACLGGFLVGREAARRMTPRGRGTILFTGATASLKGYAGSAAFAIGKFGLRALAQSMARELGPKGVHVAHVVIDGGIESDSLRARYPERVAELPEDGLLQPDAIAETYYRIHAQARSAWAHEVDLRPWAEKF